MSVSGRIVSSERRGGAWGYVKGMGAAIAFSFMLLYSHGEKEMNYDQYYGTMPPLVMRGGDPYIRALMRTISASESNVERPYAVIYGGKYVEDLSKHPDKCVTIVAGPNTGNCTTAAGRYQFITTTWEDMAKRYHPKPSGMLWWESYSFAPEFQDRVVYSWLSDQKVWGADISWMLREGRLNEVLSMLSGTWTSLGYGIEDNSMTGDLPKVYQQMLRQELRSAG